MRSPITLLAGILLILGGLALASTSVVYLIHPPRFETITRILVIAPSGSSSVYDPVFMKREVEAIQSSAVLTNVIAELGLNDSWGKRYGKGRLSNAEVEQLLRIECRPIRNTQVIDIAVASEASPMEATALANAVAQNYRRVSAQLKSADVNIIMPATMPFKATSPNRPLCIISVIAGALMVIGGMVCLKEALSGSDA
jgi:capsular polysaccharide biosynthesis protein